MSGFKISTGQDLDAIFQQRSTVDPSAQYIGYITSNGRSLSERYLPYTSGNVKTVTTGFNVTDSSGNLQDVNNYYSKILTWNAMSSGVGPFTSKVYTIYALNATNVYIGGEFTTAGGVTVNNIAKWNGTTWTPLGTTTVGVNSAVNAIYAVDASNVYVGGNFTSAGGNANIKYIARWNDTSWNAIGTGVGGTAPNVRAIYALNTTNIYVGGDFTTAGDASANRIARWDGANWTRLGTLAANGANNSVRAIYAVDASNVYVGGSFSSVAGTAVGRIAKWNGTSWSSLVSGGVNGVSGGGAIVYAIHALNVSNVYVGGVFTSAGDVSATNIAKWNDTNSTWSALTSGVSGDVTSIYALNTNNVYIGGYFTGAGSGIASRIARWDGSGWNRLGVGTFNGTNAAVSAIYALSAVNVYVGGLFTHAGSEFTANGISVNYIANWRE